MIRKNNGEEMHKGKSTGDSEGKVSEGSGVRIQGF